MGWVKANIAPPNPSNCSLLKVYTRGSAHATSLARFSINNISVEFRFLKARLARSHHAYQEKGACPLECFTCSWLPNHDDMPANSSFKTTRLNQDLIQYEVPHLHLIEGP
ncbi:Uncharacterised protein at_DN0355 [Pycnogonum litorale]